jgi:antibiotic biosynthesis monooxygenase (ABM) superfamily enzyme
LPRSGKTIPVLSVITRRFRREDAGNVDATVEQIQRVVADQPGFLGIQNSLSEGAEICELMTVFAFDSQENRRKWEESPLRKEFVAELDRLSQDSTLHTQFGDLGLLLPPNGQISKPETVAILILWILILAGLLRRLADATLPETFTSPWRDVLLISVNVVLISYVFLPWSGIALTRLKALFRKETRNR